MHEIPRYEIAALNGFGAKVVIEDTEEHDTIAVSVYSPNYPVGEGLRRGRGGAASCRLGLKEILVLVNVLTKTYPALEVRRFGLPLEEKS